MLLVAAALLRYLAVAHYGRGRGEWEESEYPAFWRDLAISTVKARRNALHAIWKKRTESSDALRRALRALARRSGREPSGLARSRTHTSPETTRMCERDSHRRPPVARTLTEANRPAFVARSASLPTKLALVGMRIIALDVEVDGIAAVRRIVALVLMVLPGV